MARTCRPSPTEEDAPQNPAHLFGLWRETSASTVFLQPTLAADSDDVSTRTPTPIVEDTATLRR